MEINGRDLRLIREMAGGTACIGGDAYASTNTKGTIHIQRAQIESEESS